MQWWPVGLAIALLSRAFVAHAGERAPTPTLVWTAPAECPTERQVEEAIARWLERSAERVDPSSLAVHADVRHDGRQWLLVLLLESPSGKAEDRITANTCATLVDVVALKVALAAMASARLRQLQVRPAPPPKRPRFAARVTGGVVAGQVTDGWNAALGVTAALVLPSARFELGASYSPPRAVRYEELPEVGANLQLFSGIGRACLVPALGRAEFPLCLGVELGLMSGRGFGASELRTSNQPFGAVVLGSALRWPLGEWLFAWLEAGTSLTFVQPTYHMRNLPELFRPDVASARGILGLECQF